MHPEVGAAPGTIWNGSPPAADAGPRGHHEAHEHWSRSSLGPCDLGLPFWAVRAWWPSPSTPFWALPSWPHAGSAVRICRQPGTPHLHCPRTGSGSKLKVCQLGVEQQHGPGLGATKAQPP